MLTTGDDTAAMQLSEPSTAPTSTATSASSDPPPTALTSSSSGESHEDNPAKRKRGGRNVAELIQPEEPTHPPRRSSRLPLPPPQPQPIADGSANIAGILFDPSLSSDEHVVPPPRQPNMLAEREAPIGQALRAARVDGFMKVTVMPSVIPGAGNGLTALTTIPANSRICGYRGVRSTSDCNARSRSFQLPGHLGFIHGDASTSFGPHANDPRDDSLVNAKIRWLQDKAYLQSTELVLPGQEIFVDYGLDFWRDRLRLLQEPAREHTRGRVLARDSRARSGSGIRAPAALASDSPSTDDSSSESDDEVFTPTSTLSMPHTHPNQAPPKKPGRQDYVTDDSWFQSQGAEDAVLDLLTRAHTLGSSIFGVEAANKWANDFTLPPEALAHDDALWVKCNGIFEDLVREKRRAVDAGRLSLERVEAHLSDNNPFRASTLDIAVEGIALCTPDDYTGCGWAGRPRKGPCFNETAPAVEKMMFESYWTEGLGILLSESRVKTMASLGLCLASWAPKLGKECGRPITNGSGRKGVDPKEFLNSKQAKQLAVTKYQHIRHPGIKHVARLISDFQGKRGVPRSRLRIWKFDIAAAYLKLSYAVESVRHVGVELRDGNYMFFLGGVFGLTSMPYAFNVITQAIVWELNNRVIKGSMLQYVDDGFVVSLDTEEQGDVDATLTFIRALLGDDAVALHKLERTKAFDFIGYHIDLPSALVTISERNTLKTIFAFGEVNLEPGTRIPVSTMQKLASLGCRYSGICTTLKPYVRILFSSFRGHRQAGSVVLTTTTRATIQTFKNMFILLGLHPRQYARSFCSFQELSPLWVCEFDASLTGVGIIWFKRSTEGKETAVAHASVNISHLGFGTDSSFQNSAEFLGALLCVQGLVTMGVTDSPILLRGDSVSALSWAQKGSVRSDLAIRAAAMWAQFTSVFAVNIVGTAHLSHERNSRTDILSRHGTWLDVLVTDRAEYGGTLPSIVPELLLPCKDLLLLVNPTRTLESSSDFYSFFSESLQFLASPLLNPSFLFPPSFHLHPPLSLPPPSHHLTNKSL